MRKGTIGQLGDYRLLQGGGKLELRKKWSLEAEGKCARQVMLAQNVLMTRRISFLLSICRPVAALLEAVDLWGVWGSSVPWVPFWRCCGISSLGYIVLTMTEE